MNKKRSILALLCLILLLTACQPLAAAAPPTGTPVPSPSPTQAPSPTLTPSLTLTALPTATRTPTPSPTPAAVDHLLDWQPLTGPDEAVIRFAFDGEWLVTEGEIRPGTNAAPPQRALYARKLNDPSEQSRREIFPLPEWKAPTMYESGSGMEIAGGRLAFTLAYYQGDSAHDYEVWLVDLESGSPTLIKASERAFPAIALSERWLAVLDSSSGYADSERCLEIFDLSTSPPQARAPFCTLDRIQWPALDGDWLAYLYFENESSCPVIRRENLHTGEQATLQTQDCPVGLQVDTSQRLTIWVEVSPGGEVYLRGRDTQGQPVELRRSRSGFQRVCGERVYYLGENQGALELRAWQPGGQPEVLHRYSPESPIASGPYSDLQCGNGWVAISGGQILAAQDPAQAHSMVK